MATNNTALRNMRFVLFGIIRVFLFWRSADQTLALGIVIGTIELIQGGAQVFRGLMTKNQINKAEAQQQQMLDSAQVQIGQASQVTAEFLMSADMMEDSEVIDALMDKWGQLEASFKQMQAEQAKYAPAMAAVKKLESRRMEEGAFKMAKGTTGIVAGALIVSGVGAPIGIAVAAIGGITPDNAGQLLDAGADMLAVVRGVFAATDIRQAAAGFARQFEH